ncbi:glycosyltransferase [Glacieibacterium megasporae]|uniref:glycosyltransferase n=1 Tax=Glacieibacterium megasporae TaxID=2835787 RepID=UPI002101D592|nr:glycosyltransferase [Polymorphobacter megasporae]
MSGVLGGLVVVIWGILLFARGGWWRMAERDAGMLATPGGWPSVVAVVPARDEASVVGRAIASLAAQDYPGEFRIILVDDASSDETAEVARRAYAASASSQGAASAPLPFRGGAGGGAVVRDKTRARGVLPTPDPSPKEEGRFSVLPASPLAPGWTGKLAAVAQGIAAAGEPTYLWLTDADIVHAPDTLRSLVARAVTEQRVLVSLMARLRCDSAAERFLVPAFVWFFAMLFPFRAIARPGKVAAAAGGVMLVDRAALERAGGIAAIRGSLIDDCALARVMKAQGPIALLLTDRSVSLRAYPRIGDIGAMISRSAYAQLDYSPLLLAGTLVGLTLTFVAPPLLTFVGSDAGKLGGALAWGMMSAAFQPMLRFYRRSPVWGAAVPLIALVYGWYTLVSAVQTWRGAGGQWKGRAQAKASA